LRAIVRPKDAKQSGVNPANDTAQTPLCNIALCYSQFLLLLLVKNILN
jgi:hypothetical protein